MEFMIMRDYTAQKSRDYMSLVTWVGIPRWKCLDSTTPPTWVYPGGWGKIAFLNEPQGGVPWQRPFFRLERLLHPGGCIPFLDEHQVQWVYPLGCTQVGTPSWVYLVQKGLVHPPGYTQVGVPLVQTKLHLGTPRWVHPGGVLVQTRPYINKRVNQRINKRCRIQIKNSSQQHVVYKVQPVTVVT